MKRKRAQAGLKADLRKGNRKKRRVVKAPVKKRPRYNIRTGGYVGVAKKYVDTWNTGTAMVAPTDAAGGELDATGVTVGALSQLLGIVQGDGPTFRDGENVRWTSIQLQGTVTCAPQVDQTAIDVGTKVFLALVLDTQTNAAQLNSEDVYSNPSASAANAPHPLRDMQRTKRFKVLRTWTHEFMPPAVSYDGTNIEQGGLIWSFDCYINLDITQQYVSNSSVISSIQDNSFHLIGYTNSTALAPTVQYLCRGRFSDV